MSSNPLRVLRHNAYARFWTAGVVSDTGTWMQAVALGVLVARETGKAGSTGLVAAAAFIPNAIAGPIAGVLADRYDRRKIVLLALFVQTLLTAGLAVTVATGHTSPVTLSLIVLLQGMVKATGAPALLSLLPDLVPEDELLDAVSLAQMTWNAGRFMGPMLAALGIATIGETWVIGANALGSALSFLAVSTIRAQARQHHHDDEGAGVLARLRDGVRMSRQMPSLRFAMLAVVVFGFTSAPLVGLVAIYAVKVQHGGSFLTGTLTTCLAIGSIVTSMLIPTAAARLGQSKVIAGSFLILCASVIVIAYAPHVLVAVAGFPFLGTGITAYFVNLSATVQRDTPPQHRARVLALFMGLNGLTYGIGIIGYGRLGDAIGLRHALALGAAAGIVLLVVSRLLQRDLWAAIEPAELVPAASAPAPVGASAE